MLPTPRVVILAAPAAACLLALAPATGAAPLSAHHHRGRHHHRDTARGTQCTGADTAATSAAASAMRSAVVCLVNHERVAHGLPALSANTKLDGSAQSWTNQMVASGDFTHGPGDAFATRISNAGYEWQAAGENIATGYTTPRQVVRAWMASPEHCQNILDPAYRDVGTGVNPAPVGSWASGPSTWTQDFGLLLGDAPPSRDRAPMSGCPYSS